MLSAPLYSSLLGLRKTPITEKRKGKEGIKRLVEPRAIDIDVHISPWACPQLSALVFGDTFDPTRIS